MVRIPTANVIAGSAPSMACNSTLARLIGEEAGGSRAEKGAKRRICCGQSDEVDLDKQADD